MTAPTIIQFRDYDPAKACDVHEYPHEGKLLTSVTTLLEKEGLGPDSKWYTPGSGDRGSIVHTACEYLAHGDLDWNSVPPEYVGYVVSWERFLEATRPQWEYLEIPFADLLRMFAGKPDACGVLAGNPMKAIVDIKTGAMQKKFALQTAAYGHLAYPNQPVRRIIVRLKRDGKMPLVDEFPVANYFNDLNAFFSIVNTVQWRERNGYGDWTTRRGEVPG